MRKTDFTNHLIRCSQIAKIMPNAKSGGGLSVGAKTYLKELHTENFFGRRKEINSKYLQKGIQVEEKSISLYSEVTGEFLVKNEERLSNLYITGEPDQIDDLKVRDFKSSWSIHSFRLYNDSKISKDNLYQIQGYLALTGLKEAEIVYTLIDTPDHLIEDEKRRISWKDGSIELDPETEAEIEASLTYNDIPKALRIRVFHIERDEEIIKKIYNKVILARIYLNELSEEIAERIPEEIEETLKSK